jgi:hypothetical protein
MALVITATFTVVGCRVSHTGNRASRTDDLMIRTKALADSPVQLDGKRLIHDFNGTKVYTGVARPRRVAVPLRELLRNGMNIDEVEAALGGKMDHAEEDGHGVLGVWFVPGGKVYVHFKNDRVDNFYSERY